MGEDKRVPAIRFEGFTEPWEMQNLGDIGTTFTGLSGKSKCDFGHGQARFVTYMNVFSNPISCANDLGLIEIDNKQNSVRYGDVFFTTSSETPEEVGMSSVWLDSKENVYLNSFCFGYRPLIKINPFYFAYLLRSSFVRDEFILLAQGSTRFNISKTAAVKISVPIADDEDEQIAIGDFFRNLDDTIALKKQEYEKTLTIKKAMLEKMFPKKGANVPEIRFEGFTGAWEQRKLGKISSKVIEKNTGMIYAVTFTNSAEQGIISQRDFFDKDISNKQNLGGYFVVRPNDFVYNPRVSRTAPVGPIKRNKLERTGVMSPLYFVFTFSEGDYGFFEKYFESHYWHDFMIRNGDSGARFDRFNIKDTLFVEMPLPFPKMEEQTAIADFFYNLDILIESLRQELEKLQNIKSACLSKMFV